ncbi:MAG: LPS export ABC transporter periplasmic protein LptC [Nitrospinota bacterium]
MKGIKKLRLFLVLIILFITFLTAVFLIINSYRGVDYISSVEMTKRGIDLIMRRVRLVEKRSGQKEWELLAKRAELDKSINKINLVDIKATFYPADKRPIIVSSKKGIVNNESKDIELSGDVFIKSDDGYKLNTEHLLWIASQRMLETDGFVKITGERFKITGNGLISKIDSQDITIKSQVEALYY